MEYTQQHIERNKQFIHHHRGGVVASIREVVFGIEDGMVSTLGALTGIAASVGDPFVIIVSGCVIIAVESIAMSVGSYLSNTSSRDVIEKMIAEKGLEFEQQKEAEIVNLEQLYIRDGWPVDLATTMATTAAQKKDHFVREIAFRELDVSTTATASPVKDATFMFISYVIGGAVPLLSYFFMPVPQAIFISIGFTLVGLFFVGSATTRFTGRKWWKAGLEMLILASCAAVVGYAIGQLVDSLFLR